MSQIATYIQNGIRIREGQPPIHFEVDIGGVHEMAAAQAKAVAYFEAAAKFAREFGTSLPHPTPEHSTVRLHRNGELTVWLRNADGHLITYYAFGEELYRDGRPVLWASTVGRLRCAARRHGKQAGRIFEHSKSHRARSRA